MDIWPHHSLLTTTYQFAAHKHNIHSAATTGRLEKVTLETYLLRLCAVWGVASMQGALSFIFPLFNLV